MNWIKISVILCVFGCLKDFRPSESFVTDYLTGPWKNFTAEEVNQDIYPVSTYSYFATLLVILLITDFVRYKPIILLCGLSGVTCFLIMIFGKTIIEMQVLEFFYGLFLSSEIGYQAYIYSKVDKKHYQEVTGHTRAALLVGRCMGGIIAQLTASFDLLDYHQLNYLTVAAIGLATIWACFLPSVGQSLYFHRRNPIYEDNPSTLSGSTPNTNNGDRLMCNSQQQLQQNLSSADISVTQKLKKAYRLLWRDFVCAYTNLTVIKWSVYWAVSSCGYLQVISYIQLLWQTGVNPGDKIYNGAVDSIYAIIGACIVSLVGKAPLNWSLLGDAVLSVFSIIQGGLILVPALSHNIWLMYGCYIVYGVIYHSLVTICSFEVAKLISEDSFGLISGTNIFFELLLQSLLTLIVLNGSLALDIRAQYYVYSGYFIVLGIVYFIIGIISFVHYRKSGKELTIWSSEKAVLEKAQGTENGKSADVGSTALV